ncbi:TIGR01177 family methyltransferase [Halorubrum trueperi]|uniref:TIGR01177 family methyltransferase n=1 Tax=Halorubrum trueperi TaxID=2004704 RepID=A0ABD5UN90_9EURY
MYWLELAGEEDAFAAYEASTAAAGVELLAPGIASAGSVGNAESADRRDAPVSRLAYTRTAHEAIARTDAGVAAAVAALEAAPIDRSGSVAVRARNVRNATGVSTTAAERALGDVLVDRGFSVDLDDPDHVLRALFAAGERADHDAVPGADGGDASVCALGWVAVEAARDFAPKPTDRPFFQPGSMEPADARAYVNLAGAAPERTVLDPMCGTGGIPLEAGLVGADVLACDAQGKMVRGTRENLREYVGGPGGRPAGGREAGGREAGRSTAEHADDDADGGLAPTWHVARADATALPLRKDAVDGVAFDAPYGRQSKIARHELADLVAGALAEAARVAARAVVIADRDWRAEAHAAGWTVDAAFERRVHRSLTRHVLVLDRD